MHRKKTRQRAASAKVASALAKAKKKVDDREAAMATPMSTKAGNCQDVISDENLDHFTPSTSSENPSSSLYIEETPSAPPLDTFVDVDFVNNPYPANPFQLASTSFAFNPVTSTSQTGQSVPNIFARSNSGRVFARKVAEFKDKVRRTLSEADWSSFVTIHKVCSDGQNVCKLLERMFSDHPDLFEEYILLVLTSYTVFGVGGNKRPQLEQTVSNIIEERGLQKKLDQLKKVIEESTVLDFTNSTAYVGQGGGGVFGPTFGSTCGSTFSSTFGQTVSSTFKQTFSQNPEVFEPSTNNSLPTFATIWDVNSQKFFTPSSSPSAVFTFEGEGEESSTVPEQTPFTSSGGVDYFSENTSPPSLPFSPLPSATPPTPSPHSSPPVYDAQKVGNICFFLNKIKQVNESMYERTMGVFDVNRKNKDDPFIFIKVHRELMDLYRAHCPQLLDLYKGYFGQMCIEREANGSAISIQLAGKVTGGPSGGDGGDNESGTTSGSQVTPNHFNCPQSDSHKIALNVDSSKGPIKPSYSIRPCENCGTLVNELDKVVLETSVLICPTSPPGDNLPTTSSAQDGQQAPNVVGRARKGKGRLKKKNKKKKKVKLLEDINQLCDQVKSKMNIN